MLYAGTCAYFASVSLLTASTVHLGAFNLQLNHLAPAQSPSTAERTEEKVKRVFHPCPRPCSPVHSTVRSVEEFSSRTAGRLGQAASSSAMCIADPHPPSCPLAKCNPFIRLDGVNHRKGFHLDGTFQLNLSFRP